MVNNVIKILFGLFFIIILNLSANLAENNSDNVTMGWTNIAENNFEQARLYFEKAIEEDDNNPRAYMALAFIEQLLDNNEKAWDWYEKAIANTENPHPYIFASMLTKRGLLSPEVDIEKGLIKLLPDIENKPDETGVLRAGVLERLGQFELEYGNADKANEYFQKMGAIDQWKVIGPFENISASGYDKKFAPEVEFNSEREYSGKNEVPVKWFAVKEIRRDKWIDFRRYFAAAQSTFYGNTFVYSPELQVAQIRVGTSGSVKVFLNDEVVLSCMDENNNDLDTYIVETQLQKGWNRLLIKCGYSEISECNYLVRITDAEGYPLENIKTDINEQEYKSRPNAQVKSIRNFAEVFFEEMIKENPEQIENYLLLSECYLRNDKAPEAERVLRKAAQMLPESVLIKDYLMEAYLRGEKDDEFTTIIEKIFSLYPDVPHIIEYKYSEYIKNKNLEKAEELANRYIELLPQSSNALIFKMTLAFQKGDVNTAIAFLSEAYEKFPKKWDVAYLSAIVSIQKTQGYDEAIKIYENYLKYRRSENAYLQLADNYLKASLIDKYEESYKELIIQDPAASGIYFNMAKIFNQLQQYDKAEGYLDKCLEICPFYSAFWSFSGQINQNKGLENEAIKAYKTAIKYNPKDYDSRNRLRKLEGAKYIFNNFSVTNIDSLIKNAPNAVDFPEDNVIYLLDDRKRVVYDRGGSEITSEVLIKLFNADGIDSFKDYWLPYNRYSEQLIIDKAVVIKPDGTEIKADVNENQLVFKSLEPNDFIHILWRIQSYNSGKLSAHIWEEIYFNYYVPVQNINYSLLVPKEFKFSHKTQNMNDEPNIKETPDGILYEWRLTNQPSIKTEYNMATLDDIGKMLYISSIPDWKYIVDWYLDLTKDKTRISYEIQEKVDELLATSPEATDLEKIELIYNFITENIRYSSISFRQSGLIPQKARNVLVQRIGDCKDVTTLCIAMLKAAGISAHYVLVNTFDEGQNKNILPSLDFNHAIAGVETEQGVIYLDLTAQNYPMLTLPEGDLDAFALSICPDSEEPFYISNEHCAANFRKRKSVVKLHEDNSAEINKLNSRWGLASASFRSLHRFSSDSERIRDLTESLADEYPNLTVTEFKFFDIDKIDQLLEDSYSFTVPHFLEEAGNMKLLTLPWSDDLEPRRALSYENREYDYYYRSESDSVFENMTIMLPEGFEPLGMQNNVEYKCPAAEYNLTLEYDKGELIAKRKFVNKMSIIPTTLYKEFKEFFNKVVRSDQQKILLQKIK